MVDTKPETEIIKRTILAGETGLQLRSLDDMFRFAQYAVKSGLVPESFKTPEQVLIAVQAGAELSLPPMKALSSICVIKGRPTLWGDTALGLVKNSGKLEYCKEYFELNGAFLEENLVQYEKIEQYPANLVAVCNTKRVGDDEPTVRYFSVSDAKLAGLWKKAGPWMTHPKRMLKYKARAFNLRDAFPDILCGMHLTEEMIDEAPLPAPECDTPQREVRRKKINVQDATVYVCGHCGNKFSVPEFGKNENGLTLNGCPKCGFGGYSPKESESPAVPITDENTDVKGAAGTAYEEVLKIYTDLGGKNFTVFAADFLCRGEDEVDSPEKFTDEMIAQVKRQILNEGV